MILLFRCIILVLIYTILKFSCSRMLKFHGNFQKYYTEPSSKINHICFFKCSFQASVLSVLPHHLLLNGVDIQKLDANNLRNLVSWVSPPLGLISTHCCHISCFFLIFFIVRAVPSYFLCNCTIY
jgi:hypothetical protein